MIGLLRPTGTHHKYSPVSRQHEREVNRMDTAKKPAEGVPPQPILIRKLDRLETTMASGQNSS